MAVTISNPQVVPQTLPFPLKGVLSAGKTIVLNSTASAVSALAPGIAELFKLTDLPASYPGPYDTAYDPGLSALASGKTLIYDGSSFALSSPAGGSGDVVGPGASIDNEVLRAHLTTGKILQQSGVSIEDAASSQIAVKIQTAATGMQLQGNVTTATTPCVQLTNANTLSASSGAQVGVSIAPTIGQSSTASFDALLVNITGSPGSGGATLVRCQNGGTDRFTVTSNGVVTASAAVGSATTPVLSVTNSSNWNSSSAAQTGISVTGTVAQTGTATFAALLLNPTISSSGGATYLIRGQSGGTDRFTVTTGGQASINNSCTIFPSLAPPAGGAASCAYLMSSTAGLGVYFGNGAPTVSAAKGSLYLRTDGTTTNDRAYINTNGTTGWTALTTAS